MQWWYKPDSWRHPEPVAGPVTIDALVSLIEKRQLSPDVWVTRPGLSWREADIVPEILERLPLLQLPELAAAYIQGAVMAPWPEELWWAWEKMDRLVRNLPEEAWRAILLCLYSTSDERVLGMVAAGPLEDFLCLHGPAFLDRVLAEAQQRPWFRRSLRGVWGWSEMSPSVRAAIDEAVKDEPPL